MIKKFQRRKEDFVCENCGEKVEGNGYTNHCPKCLFSKHVDNFPGDRKNKCGGLMKPRRIEKEKDKLYVIQFCQKCSHQKRNKISSEDNIEKIQEIMKKDSEDFWKN